jgi:hypothetical protein
MIKSIRAGLTGIIVGAVLSFGTDFLLKGIGVLPPGNLYVSVPLILFVLLYRSTYNSLGCYIAAKFAPSNPMQHALVLGAIGTVLSIAGAITTADMHLGPAWYAWTLAALTMPSAWLGGMLCVRHTMSEQNSAVSSANTRVNSRPPSETNDSTTD